MRNSRSLRGAAALALLFTLSAAGARSAEELRPTGVLVPVEGRRLHLNCTGAGAHTVVLEAGLGGSHLGWTLVQPVLAERARVCSYDRAGYGFSDPGPFPRTLAAASSDLHALLQAAGIEGRVLLVGHSFGGLLALDFARRWPDRVAGLVLVDSMHPEEFERFAEAGVSIPSDPASGRIRFSPADLTRGLPASVRPLAFRLAAEDKTRAVIYAELRALPESMREMTDAPLPAVAARVLVHGERQWDRVTPNGRMEDAWRRMQADLASELGAPPPILVPQAGHDIPLDQPARLVAAIGTFMDELGW